MADGLLLDTNVLIDLARNSPRAPIWRPLVADKVPIVCFVTVADCGRKRSSRPTVHELRRTLRATVNSLVVVPSTDDLAEERAKVVTEARGLGQALGAAELGKNVHAQDAWIAATARLHGLPLLTGNRRHFEGLPGLQLVDLPDS
ncbi:MAG: PIN domain-containing protein [Solirubrobacteraceae bacterium]